MESRKLKVPGNAKYWFEVAAYAQPYAQIGSIILSGLSFLEKTQQTKRLEKIIERVDEIESKIQKCKDAATQKIEDVILRQKTAEVLGTKEMLEEYGRLKRDAVLVNLTTESAIYKSAIFISIADEKIPLEYRGAYCGLYCTLLPIRAIALELLSGGDRREEIEDLLAIEDVTLAIMEAIGRNRVSPKLEVETVDVYKKRMEMRHKRNYYSEVDGEKTTIETVIEKRLNEGRSLAEKKLTELSNEMANEAKKPFQTIFDGAKKSLENLP